MELRTIRKQLKLSRLDMALYLGISIEMVKSIELNRRMVPFDSLDPQAELIKGLLNVDLQRQAAAQVSPATSRQIREMKYLIGIYDRRARNYKLKLKKMQEQYATASMGLVVMQQLATSLAEATRKEDRIRLKLAKMKIHELTYILQVNNQTAQDMLELERSSLQTRVERLEALLATATSR